MPASIATDTQPPRKVAWGILSTARIGREKVIPAMQQAHWCDVQAIASRSLTHAQSVAHGLGIARAYGSYEELIADPQIEAIYNPLPNDQHVAWTLLAAQAGKHVLCEKPFAMNTREAALLEEVAGRVHIMEAFMVRFHPQWAAVRECVRSGEWGQVHTVQAFFSYFNRDANNIRNQTAAGGGALYDIGCYPIVIGRYIFEAEPRRVIALVDRDPDFQTDRSVSALLDFGGGRRLDFTVSTQSVAYQRVQIFGTRERVEVQIPFNAPLGAATHWYSDNGASLEGASVVAHSVPACNMYGLQGDAFSLAVQGRQALPYGLADAVCNMRVIDALFASEQSGAWVNV